MSPLPGPADAAPRPSARPRPGPLPRWADLKAIADAQRMVLVALLVGILALPATALLASAGGDVGDAAGVGPIAVTLLVVALRVWMAVMVYRLARALGSGVGALWAIGAFLPNLIGLVVLVVISSRATGRLKRAGLRVGLLGAKLPEKPPAGFLCEEVAGAFS